MGMPREAKLALQNLEYARAHLRTYQDLLWGSIDHRDSTVRAQGVAIYETLEARMAELDALASQIRQVIDGRNPQPRRPSHPATNEGGLDSHSLSRAKTLRQPTHRRRMSPIADGVPLDRAVPYSLDTDFTATAPWGFEFQDYVETGMGDWTSLYTRICQFIEERFPGNLQEYRIETGRVLVGRDQSRMESPKHVANGLYVETKLDNNYKARNLKYLLQQIGFSPAALRIFLERGPSRLRGQADAPSRRSGTPGHLITKPQTP